MLFMYPMYDHESQRIGKQRCTPLGYRLHVIAELLGFIGLLLLLGIGAYLRYRWYADTFHRFLFWLLIIPFALDCIGNGLYWYSWRLAGKKEFCYDYETREASWMENGERRVYRWTGA